MSDSPGPTAVPKRSKTVLLALLLIPVALLLMYLDVPVAEFCRDARVGNTNVAEWLREDVPRTIMRLPGEYMLTLVCAVILLIFHAQTWRAAGLLILAGLAGAINALLKWVAGRSRPFRWGDAWDWDFFRGEWSGLINGKDLSFASGHATQAFAWATAMSIALPRYRYFFFACATLTGVQRVASTDHYLTDVLVGAAIGVVTVRLLFRILSRIVPLAKDPPEAELTDLPRPQAD